MTGSPGFPARLVVLAALVLSAPTLQQVLVGELSVANAALRFALALVVAALGAQVVLVAVPRQQPAERASAEPAGEPASPDVPARRADDLPAEEPAQAA